MPVVMIVTSSPTIGSRLSMYLRASFSFLSVPHRWLPGSLARHTLCVEGESSPASCQPKQEWLVHISYRCYPQVGIRGTRPWDSKYCSTVVSNGSRLLTTYCGVKAADELYIHLVY